MSVAPRITATETEWGLLVQTRENAEAGNRPINPEGKLDTKMLMTHLPDGVTGWNFLSNGMRLYPDSGSHPETATGEDISFEGGVTNEIAAERVMRIVMDKIVDDPRTEIIGYQQNKRLIADNGKTWGHHENYSASARKLEIDEKSLALLGIHLATRNIWAGAGYVAEKNGGPVYRLAQKAPHTHIDFGNSSTNTDKPIINLRNEPWANPKKLRRVHVTSGDANMSPWAMWMTLGTTSIVIRLIEEGFGDIREMTPSISLIEIAKLVADDFSFSKTVPLKYDESITPLDMQQRLVDMAYCMLGKDGLTAEEYDVLAEWQRALDDIAKDPTRLADRADWAGKKEILDVYIEKLKTAGVPPNKQLEVLRAIDRLWDEISDQGIGIQYRQSRWAEWMPSEADITKAITTPPAETRAHVRGYWIGRRGKIMQTAQSAYSTNWNVVGKLAGRSTEYRNVDINDPFDNTL